MWLAGESHPGQPVLRAAEWPREGAAEVAAMRRLPRGISLCLAAPEAVAGRGVVDSETVAVAEVGGLYVGNASGQQLYLDAGYESKDDVVRECGMTPVICEKGHRNHPLTDEQKQSNRQKSKTRCRVEHIFGFIEGSMNGSFVRSIGIIRAKAATALTCLVYNIFRYVQINKYQPQLIASMG